MKNKNKKAELTRRVVFSASHRLHDRKLSDKVNKKIFGKCNHKNGHGHNYVLEVTVAGEVDPKTGMVMNMTDLKALIEKKVMRDFDHKNVNVDVAEFKKLNPTAENMAIVIWERLRSAIPKKLTLIVQLQETENISVVYRGF